MIKHAEIDTNTLKSLLHNGGISHGGNQKLKIYGNLRCSSGKRMKQESRVFFVSKQEAETLGYRPCGHCMNKEYKLWKNKHELF